ncbi:MAG TPA: DUF6159 family protein [Acidimicrobiales bacterium]|nr:DUF6159 family protein [Acidimicrobiales bacterium]
MGRFERGLRLARASWEVLRGDAQLMWLPVVSTLAILVFATAILSPTFISGVRSTSRGTVYLLFAAVYFVSSLIATFFNAAVVAAASDRLSGGRGTAVDGMRTAWSRIDRIIAWAALSATVGLVLRGVEQRAGIFGAVVGRLAGVAWSVVTFLVVPILVFEPVGPIEAVKRSGLLFRSRWGEQLVGNGSISAAMIILAIPLALVCAVLATIAAPLAIAFGVLAFGVLMAAGSAMTAIFNAALYRYAVSGEVVGPFGADDLRGAFRRR